MSLCMSSIVVLVISVYVAHRDHGAFHLSSVCFLQSSLVVLLYFLVCHVYLEKRLATLFCQKMVVSRMH
jgi:hypothetical protein